MSVLQMVIDVIRLETPEHHGPITHETKLVEDLDRDSLEAVEIVMELEETFGIKIPDDEMPQVGDGTDMTVGELANLITKHGATL